MEILVSGSLAYDRIMDFPGRFSEHILPEQIHMINVSFTVNSLTENFGGTAGNIAYALSLLGEKPRIVATIGQDYHRYFEWLASHDLGAENIRVVTDELTAGAYITTDLDNNQITGFNPGAMKQQAGFDYDGIAPKNTVAIVAPGNLLGDTIEHIIVTKGEHGAELMGPGGPVYVPAVPTDSVLDPTGAGDAFRGGFIKGLIEGQTLERSVQMASVCGHYAVQTYGTQEYSFTADEFRAKLEQHYGG